MDEGEKLKKEWNKALMSLKSYKCRKLGSRYRLHVYVGMKERI